MAHVDQKAHAAHAAHVAHVTHEAHVPHAPHVPRAPHVPHTLLGPRALSTATKRVHWQTRIEVLYGIALKDQWCIRAHVAHM